MVLYLEAILCGMAKGLVWKKMIVYLYVNHIWLRNWKTRDTRYKKPILMYYISSFQF